MKATKGIFILVPPYPFLMDAQLEPTFVTENNVVPEVEDFTENEKQLRNSPKTYDVHERQVKKRSGLIVFRSCWSNVRTNHKKSNTLAHLRFRIIYGVIYGIIYRPGITGYIIYRVYSG
jgi:hypothetical protein